MGVLEYFGDVCGTSHMAGHIAKDTHFPMIVRGFLTTSVSDGGTAWQVAKRVLPGPSTRSAQGLGIRRAKAEA